MTFSIAALQPADREAWQKLYYGYADFYGMPMDQQILDRVWSWIFSPEQRFFALIARDEEGNGVGLMHYREMLSPLRGAKVGFLDDLFVDPACRGSGLVDELFLRLKQEAQAHNWPFVRWVTADDNYRGRAAYDRLADKTHWLTYQMSAD
ncbi:MAG: GNAT family N-acetyltransferase [Motiliproteus sp.]